jgi:hypothetical protein
VDAKHTRNVFGKRSESLGVNFQEQDETDPNDFLESK